MDVVNYLRSKSIEFNIKEKDNVYIECPWCGETNLSISMYSGMWHCWSATCTVEKRAGSFKKLLKKYGLNADDVVLDFKEPPIVDKTLTEEQIKIIEASRLNKAEIIEWAASRGLDGAFCLKHIGWDLTQHAVVFPFIQGEKLIGAKFKSERGQWVVGEEPKLYVLDRKDLKRERIVIVEGEVDALTLKQNNIPCVATLGAAKTKGFDLLASVRTIYIGFDMDPGGDAGSDKAAQLLGTYRCKRVKWGDKDPNDWVQAGADKEALVQAVKTAKSMVSDTSSVSGLEALNVYFEEHEKGLKPRRSWGFKRLDSFTKGLGGGELIGVLAESGTGKTTFILNVIRNHVAQGINCGFASLEEHPIHEITPKLYSCFLAKNISNHGLSRNDAKEVEKEMRMVQLYNKGMDRQKVFDWIRECYYVHGCEMVAVDYFQLMVGDEESVQDIKETIFTFKGLTVEMPGLCIVLIIQPKQKQKARAKDGSEAKSLKLDGADARGGSAINQTVDKMLTIKGVHGHPNLTQFEYTKARGHLNVSKKDWLSKYTQLEYDHETLRMSELAMLIYGD